jgi:hypothetical protein
MSDNHAEHGRDVIQTARVDFEWAYRKGFWRAFFSRFTGADQELLPFDEIRAHIPFRGEHSIGLREVPLDQIVGSVNRYNDFDRAFLPRQTHTRSRWESIDRAHLRDVILPPIELYKIGEIYFVKDGNHRVSVARERGQAFIDAYVIEVISDVAIDAHTDVDSLILQQEKRRFYSLTRLDTLRPNSSLSASIPGAFDHLLEHIQTHQYFMGLNLGREIPYEEAVTSWYDDVYLPLVLVLRQQNILRQFPRRTETDLYLWVIEHLWYMQQGQNKTISLQEAADHFAEEFSANPLRRLFYLMRNHIVNLFRKKPPKGISPSIPRDDPSL